MNADIAPSITLSDLNNMYLYERQGFLMACKKKIEKLEKERKKELDEIQRHEQEMKRVNTQIPSIPK